MGYGGAAKNAQSSFNQSLQMMELQNQQLAASEQAQTAQEQAADQAAQAQAAQEAANANGTSSAAQAAQKLGVMDFIHTTPEGLLNQPKTGKMTLLGN